MKNKPSSRLERNWQEISFADDRCFVHGLTQNVLLRKRQIQNLHQVFEMNLIDSRRDSLTLYHMEESANFKFIKCSKINEVGVNQDMFGIAVRLIVGSSVTKTKSYILIKQRQKCLPRGEMKMKV